MTVRRIVPKMKVTRGDITGLKVQAIVNLADKSLFGGGGVDGAVHKAVGPELLVECRTLGDCPAGEARLMARHVIHTVAPVWQGRDHGEVKLLASWYSESLKLAIQH